VERQATAGALAARGRLNATITVPSVTPQSVGALLYLFELATAYAGELYEVNAFDQPGVELGKQFAYAMLGRPGSEAARAQWDALPKPDPRWQV
jgi:glucose-6-phosphate isomerase